MDPNTTLFTFMLQTQSSVQSVSLVGSWDNFSSEYPMERDVRRDRGQWRGCYNFKDIICDGDRPGSSRRNGGLKMGQPYYYYYELDGTIETHDPSVPSTSACPYLPGQTVNIMVVPAEKSERKRSASLSSIRQDDFKTMDPDSKFITPRPAPPLPELLNPTYRLPTSHVQNLKHKRSDRSISPTPPSWWSPRKLFARKNSTSSQSSGDRQSYEGLTSGSSWPDEKRGSVGSSSDGGRTRAMSPESLRRFLSDDIPMVSESTENADRLALFIPDDIVEEDDDNFATSTTSAVSDSIPKTVLSPPPQSRNHSSNTIRPLPGNESVVTLRHIPKDELLSPRTQPTMVSSQQPSSQINDFDVPISRFSFSSDEGSVLGDDMDSTPPENENEIPSIYHSEAEDDDNDTDMSSPATHSQRSAFAMGRESWELSMAEAFKGYRLPQTSIDTKAKLASPALIARDSGEASVSVLSSPPLLAAPAGSLVDDFASELNDCFQSKWV